MKNRFHQHIIILIALFVCNIFFLHAQDEDNGVKMELRTIEQDTLRQIVATLTKTDSSGATAPVSDIEVHFYVQRTFGQLPVGGAYTTTDEKGEVLIDFPMDVPGNEKGDLTVIAKVEDDETLGNMETTLPVHWGVPVVNTSVSERKLWASAANAPLGLILFINGAIVVVWGIIVYVIIQLFKIKKSF